MVRKDPLNERGPKPKGGYPTKVTTKRIAAPQSLLMLQPETEYKKLWNHVSVGASSVIGLIEAYSHIGMPLPPIATLKDFITRLQIVVEREENR